ncbi:MAG TPA: TolC family protein [Polyangiaceae bacterium]|nr:TolC family protein [Polyangiaceae bacterium]
MRKASLFALVQTLATLQAAAPARAAQQPPPPAQDPLTVPPLPQIDDPMLAPVPPPARLLGSWQEAIGYLRARSTDLRIALDQVLQAEAQTRIALAQYLPTITANGVYTRQLITRTSTGLAISPMGVPLPTSSQIPVPDTLAGNVQLSQEVINAPDFDQISIDELNEDATRLSVDDVKRTLALGLANQIVAVVTAERSAEINRVGLNVALAQLDIAKHKQALGAATGLDVVRADQNAANARATLVTGDESLRQAREALGLALGVPEETGVARDVNIDGLAATAAASCRVVGSVDDRPDVAAARVGLDVAKRNLQNVWLTFLPTVTVQSSMPATFTPAPPSTYPNPTWNIQAVLSVPIWDGGARYGGLRNARAAEDIAAQKLEALRRQAIIQVEQARRQVVVAETSDRVARQQRDLAAQNDDMTQKAYAVGQGTSLELVTASEAHRQAELNLALADFNVVKARILAVLALATCPW